jgi:hypothetical protein
MEIATAILSILAAITPKIITWIKEAIESGNIKVEDLLSKPDGYYVSLATEALSAQAEAESHLPE